MIGNLKISRIFHMSTLLYIAVILISLIKCDEACGFEKYKVKKFSVLDDHHLRFLQEPKTFEPIRIFYDFTTLNAQVDISTSMKDALKKVLNNAKDVFETLIQVNRYTSKLRINQCDGQVSISTTVRNSGVDADLIVFPFINTKEDSSVVAYASACIISGKNNRPVAGFIGFTLNFDPTKANWERYYTSIALHELTHVLVFNSDVFDLFVDENGQQIARDKTIKEQVDGSKTNLFIVSPKALEAARKHFNCPGLQHIPLENQGGLGTSGSHWEAKTMLSDYMVGFSYDEMTISDITLGLFEDSGWYKTSKYNGGLFRYGKNAGCSFLDSKCINSEGEVTFKNEFCNTINTPFCTAGKLSKGFCFITSHTNLDPAFQYFPNKNQGGLTLTNYCPVAAVPTNSTNFFSWSCLDGYKGQFMNEFEENISSTSACFTSSLIKTDFVSKVPPSQRGVRAICYKYSCNFEDKSITVTIGSTSVKCPGTATAVEVKGYSGGLLCPDFWLICTAQPPCSDLIDCALKKTIAFSDGNTYTPTNTGAALNDTMSEYISNTTTYNATVYSDRSGVTRNNGSSSVPTVNGFHLYVNIYMILMLLILY
jgi:leishmanolysin-like peptidase